MPPFILKRRNLYYARLSIPGELRDHFKKTEFKKNFKLGDIINTQDIDAQLEAGILTVTLAKKEEQKPRTISVS